MQRTLSRVHRILRHPAWILLAVAGISVAFVNNQRFTQIRKVRDFIDPKEFDRYNFNEYYISMTVLKFVVYRDSGSTIQVRDIPSLGEDLHVLNGLVDEEGILRLFHQEYYLNESQIPGGVFFQSFQTYFARFNPRVISDKYDYWKDYLNEQDVELELWSNVGSMSSAEFDEFVLYEYLATSGKSKYLLKKLDNSGHIIKWNSMHFRSIYYEILWPGAIYESLVIATQAVGMYSMCCLPFWIRYRNRTNRGLCIKCGYSLDGITNGVCPECGKAFAK